MYIEGLLLTSQKAPLEREPPTNIKKPRLFLEPGLWQHYGVSILF